MGREISSTEGAKQLLLFNDMGFAGAMGMTDIDGAADFGPDLFVFVEVKHHNAILRDGQKIHLTRLVDTIDVEKATAYCLIARHGVDTNESVGCGSCIVSEIRINKPAPGVLAGIRPRDWIETSKGITVRDALRAILKAHGRESQYLKEE